jgi:hypothetical protein
MIFRFCVQSSLSLIEAHEEHSTNPNHKLKREKYLKNSIFAIKPYQWEGMWVFDDPNVGLVKEPFVGGADTIIDVATSHIPNAKEGFIAVFSANYFPDAQIVLDWTHKEGGGNVYRWAEKGMVGWLCPALLKYFVTAPPKLYLQVKAAEIGMPITKSSRHSKLSVAHGKEGT